MPRLAFVVTDSAYDHDDSDDDHDDYDAKTHFNWELFQVWTILWEQLEAEVGDIALAKVLRIRINICSANNENNDNDDESMTRCQDCGDNDDIDNQDGDDDWPGSEVSSRTWRANQLRCRSPVDQTNDDDIQNMMKNLLTASEVEAAMMMISKTMILMMIRMKIIVTMMMMKISKTMLIIMSMIKIKNLFTATKVEVTQSVTMAGKGSNLGWWWWWWQYLCLSCISIRWSFDYTDGRWKSKFYPGVG